MPKSSPEGHTKRAVSLRSTQVKKTKGIFIKEMNETEGLIKCFGRVGIENLYISDDIMNIMECKSKRKMTRGD